MKRILLLLLFNLSVVLVFSQTNGYFKSTHIINSDSTHGELNGTEYINNDGKFRYKENGVWKYRASTADLASAGISNGASTNELMKAQTANGDAIGAGIWSTTPANLTFGIGTTGTSRVLLADGSTSNINISLKSKGTGSSILWDGNENNFLSVASTGVTGRSNVGFYFEGTSSNTNTVLTAFRLAHNTSGTPAAGIGTALRFETETSASNLEFGSAIESVSTDVTSSSEDFDLVFKNMSGGATAAERFRFSSFGGFGIGGANYGTSGQVFTSNGPSSAPSWQTPSSATPAGLTNAIQTNSSGTFGAGNMAVLTNSVYNLTAGQNWHLGWNASGTSGSVDARRMTVGALGISIGPFVTDPLTSLHVEKSISGGSSGGTIGEAVRIRSTYNAITPLVGSGVSMNFESETSDNNYEIGAIIQAETTDVTAATEDFDLVFKLMRDGAAVTEMARLSSLSDFKLTTAGSVGPFVTFNRTGGTASTWQLKPDIGTTDFAIQDDVGGQEYLFNTSGTATAVDWVATSDRRLKYNFRPVGSQLDKINSIARLVTNYDRKDNGRNETGFIAQELLDVAPEYVNIPVDTVSGYYSVNYSKMVVPLYTGVNELQEEVIALRQEVAELKAIVKEFRRITLEASAK